MAPVVSVAPDLAADHDLNNNRPDRSEAEEIQESVAMQTTAAEHGHSPTSPASQAAQAIMPPPTHQQPSTPHPAQDPVYIPGSPASRDDRHHQQATETIPSSVSLNANQQKHPTSPKMLFSDLCKSPKSPLSKFRHSHQPQPTLFLHDPDYDADLVSKDKNKQKAAVRKFLAEKVRNDWGFTWPPASSPAPDPDASTPAPPVEATDCVPFEPRTEVVTDAGILEITPAPELESENAVEDSGDEADSETKSVYSTVSEDAFRYRPRAEWTSDLSDDDVPAASPSPFRFDSPDSVGVAVRASASARKAKRRRESRSEMEWNVGLACFNARRDAWTGARTVRLKPKPMLPASPVSPRRSLWRFHSHSNSKSEPMAPVTPTQNTHCPASTTASPLSPVTSNSRHSQLSNADTATPPTSDGDSHDFPASTSQCHPEYPVETLLPIPAPLLPPANPMRASISPTIYTSLYDKVVVHSLQPSCPINLADMTRSCVAGWKRDGEWPPRPTELPAAALVAVRRKKKEERRDSIKERRDSATITGRRMSFGGLLGRTSHEGREKEKEKKEGEKDKEKDHDETGTGKGIRRSLQRVLGFGHGHSASVGSIGNGVTREITGAG